MSGSTHPDPSPSFRYKIEIKNVTVARFSEVSGLSVESTTEDIVDGGDYSTVHRLPSKTGFKWGDLTLKRGIAADGAALWSWFNLALRGTPRPRQVTVTMLGFVPMAGGAPAILRTWVFNGAYPVKWSTTQLSAEQNAIAVETLTLAHEGLQLE